MAGDKKYNTYNNQKVALKFRINALEHTKELLKTGLAKGRYADKDSDTYCTVGAMNTYGRQKDRTYGWGTLHNNDIENLCAQLLPFIPRRYWRDFYKNSAPFLKGVKLAPSYHVICFNDHPDTTNRMIRRVIDLALKDLQERLTELEENYQANLKKGPKKSDR